MAYIVSHPLLIVPAEGEYADEEEEVMVVGEHKEVVHLFRGVLAEGVRDGVRPLPPSAEGITVSNSVVMMKWEDYEKRVLGVGKRKRDDEERLRERVRELERENVSLMGQVTSLRVQNRRLQDRAKGLESRNTVLEESVKSQQSDLQALRAQIMIAESNKSLAESKHKKLVSLRDKRVADAEAKASAELERITKIKDAAITDLMAHVNILINLGATKDAERAVHEADLKKARIEIAQQSNEIYMLQKKNKELTTGYGHIQAQLYDMTCKYEPRRVGGGV